MSDTVQVQTTTDIKVPDAEQQFAITEHHYKDIFSSSVMVGAFATIAYVIHYGDSHNSLHESAMSWSFFLILSILAGYGLGSLTSILPNFSTMLSRK